MMTYARNFILQTAVSVRNRLAAFTWSRKSRRWITVGHTAFFVTIVIWLAYQLSDIGWLDVWNSRPRTPWFYVTWLALYLQLPMTESVIFRAAWNLPPTLSLLPLFHKRTLNQDVVFGLGEAWFFLWARRRVDISRQQIAGTLKDNIITLTLAAWVSIVLIIPFTDPASWTTLAAADVLFIMTLIGISFVLAIALAMRFRRTVLTLAPRLVVALFAVHLGRFVLLVYVLQILQWWVVLPGAPLTLWVAMLIVIMIVQRVPFIPARDLAGIGAILGVLALPTEHEATIAAMLLVRTALDKSCNLALVAARLLLQRT